MRTYFIVTLLVALTLLVSARATAPTQAMSMQASAATATSSGSSMPLVRISSQPDAENRLENDRFLPPFLKLAAYGTNSGSLGYHPRHHGPG